MFAVDCSSPRPDQPATLADGCISERHGRTEGARGVGSSRCHRHRHGRRRWWWWRRPSVVGCHGGGRGGGRVGDGVCRRATPPPPATSPPTASAAASEPTPPPYVRHRRQANSSAIPDEPLPEGACVRVFLFLFVFVFVHVLFLAACTRSALARTLLHAPPRFEEKLLGISVGIPTLWRQTT